MSYKLQKWNFSTCHNCDNSHNHIIPFNSVNRVFEQFSFKQNYWILYIYQYQYQTHSDFLGKLCISINIPIILCDVTIDRNKNARFYGKSFIFHWRFTRGNLSNVNMRFRCFIINVFVHSDNKSTNCHTLNDK